MRPAAPKKPAPPSMPELPGNMQWEKVAEIPVKAAMGAVGGTGMKNNVAAALIASAGALQQSDFISLSHNGYTGVLMVVGSMVIAVYTAITKKESADDDRK
jgi:hypothetical protein